MSNQQDPNMYSLMCRCPLEDAARLRLKARERGLPMSAYVARLIQCDIGTIALTGTERKWMAERLDANKIKRAKADEETASGYYRVKKLKKRKLAQRKNARKHSGHVSIDRSIGSRTMRKRCSS